MEEVRSGEQILRNEDEVNEINTIEIIYEEYHYSVFFGEYFSNFNSLILPLNLPISNLYQKLKDLIDPMDQYSYLTFTIYSGWVERYLVLSCLRCLQCNCCTQLCICCCCNFLTEIRGIRINKAENKIKGTVKDLFIDQGMYLRYYKPRYRRGQADIGVWNINNEKYPGTKLLSNEVEKFLYNSKDFVCEEFQFYNCYECNSNYLSNFYDVYGANPSAEYSISQCSEDILLRLPILREFIDHKFQDFIHSQEISSQELLQSLSTIQTITQNDFSNIHSEISVDSNSEDFKVQLTLSQLESLMGYERTKQLLNTFFTFITSSSTSIKNSLTPQILIRRTNLSNKCIPFHIDNSSNTMQVILNKIYEVDGGNVIYIRKNQVIITKRKEGLILYHQNDILHGVTIMNTGIRYSLFFLDK